MRSSLRFMLSYVNKKPWFVLGYATLILECATPIIAILLQRNLIDQVFIGKQYQVFPSLLALYAIFHFGPKLFFTVRKVTFFHVAHHLRMNLTHGFLTKIYELPAAAFNQEHAGKLMNNIRNDIADASDVTVNQMLSETIKVLLSIVLLGSSIAYISMPMLLIVMIVAVIYYLLLNMFSEKTKQYSRRSRENKGKIAVTIEESVSAVREIIAYNRQEWQLNHFKDKFDDYYQAIIKEGLYKAKILFISEPFLYGTKLIVIFGGGMAAISNDVSLGAFVVSFTLVDQLVTELGLLFQQALMGKRLGASVSCIQSVMAQQTLQSGTFDFSDDIETIKFEGVTFAYGEDAEPVLNNLSMDFPIGKKIALVGESGSGKSTITQLLLRAYSPQKGEITINGVPVHHYSDQYTDRVSVVFQQPHFLPASIMDNLVFDKTYEPQKVESVCQEMLCYDFIQGFPNQYDTPVGERGTTLSGGQKQRIALSRVLLKNADILILDEATSALDTETEYQIQLNIDRFRKGKTTIIVAHRLSTIQNADIIYVLDKGSLVAKGTHEKLLSESAIYQKLYA